MNPGIAVLASQQPRGLGITEHGMRRGIPFQCSTQLHRLTSEGMTSGDIG